MKKFKKISQDYSSENNLENKNKLNKQAIKFSGLLILIILIISIGVCFKKDDSSDYQSTPSDITVSVTDAGGQMQDSKSVENTAGNSQQPAQNPSDAATVEQLGGDSNNPSGIDSLLEGKNIEVKK